jgi:hypothetical protein
MVMPNFYGKSSDYVNYNYKGIYIITFTMEGTKNECLISSE